MHILSLLYGQPASHVIALTLSKFVVIISMIFSFLSQSVANGCYRNMKAWLRFRNIQGEALFRYDQANRALMASVSRYLHDHMPVSVQGERQESFPMRYLFPLHMTVLDSRGINQIIPMIISLTGDRK